MNFLEYIYHKYDMYIGPKDDKILVNLIIARMTSLCLLSINLVLLGCCIVGGFYALQNNNIPLYIGAVGIIGWMQYSLGFCMTHQSIHGSLFYQKFLDKYIAEVFLRLTNFWSFRFYKKIHTAHHLHTKDTDKDPGEQGYIFRGLHDSMSWYNGGYTNQYG